eukprot:247383_1
MNHPNLLDQPFVIQQGQVDASQLTQSMPNNTQFAVVSNPTSNGQYSFLVPINQLNPSRNPSYFQQSPLPIHQSINQWYTPPIQPPLLPLIPPPTSTICGGIPPSTNHNLPPFQFQIPSTITSINSIHSLNNVNPIHNLTAFPDIKFPLLSTTDCTNNSPFKIAALANTSTSSSYPSSSPNTMDSEVKLKTMENNNRIISFNPNNSGQIVITKREDEDDPLLSMSMPSHEQMGDQEDDKRSIQSSTSSVSTNSVRPYRKPDYQCSECGKSFKHKSNLKIHAVIHTDEALQCPHCKKKFARKSNLTQHLRVHTGERPYVCAFCNKSFKQSHSLKDHVRIHTGEKPYECEFCSKSFKVKHNMVVHRRLHTGEKPFDCPLCLKKFASKSSLNGHTKKTHPNQWWSLHPDCKVGAKKYDALLSKQADYETEQQ